MKYSEVKCYRPVKIRESAGDCMDHWDIKFGVIDC